MMEVGFFASPVGGLVCFGVYSIGLLLLGMRFESERSGSGFSMLVILEAIWVNLGVYILLFLR